MISSKGNSRLSLDCETIPDEVFYLDCAMLDNVDYPIAEKLVLFTKHTFWRGRTKKMVLLYAFEEGRIWNVA